MPLERPTVGSEQDTLVKKPYLVTITRTEIITYQVEATGRPDAERRYLTEGEEVSAKTTDNRVESVVPGTAEQVRG